MGEIIDMAEFRRKKMAKRGEQQQFHPSVAKKGLFADANDEMTKRTANKPVFDVLKKIPDQKMHGLAVTFGHLPRQIDIFDLKDVNYDEVRWKLANDTDFHSSLRDAMGTTEE